MPDSLRAQGDVAQLKLFDLLSWVSNHNSRSIVLIQASWCNCSHSKTSLCSHVSYYLFVSSSSCPILQEPIQKWSGKRTWDKQQSLSFVRKPRVNWFLNIPKFSGAARCMTGATPLATVWAWTTTYPTLFPSSGSATEALLTAVSCSYVYHSIEAVVVIFNEKTCFSHTIIDWSKAKKC